MSRIVPLPQQEVNFYNLVKGDCDIIFDIGVREDVEYVLNSYDKSRKFYFFDPDATFLKSLEDKINNLPDTEEVDHEIYLNCFGLGSEKGEMIYYSDTQSFIFRTIHTTSAPSNIVFPINTLKDYCEENSISKIDFLKIDIEGMEIDCLRGGEDIINSTCKYVQFEFASTMLDRNITPEELVSFFDSNFDLFLLQVDPPHPFYAENKKLLTPLSDEIYQRVKKDMYEASGCNFVAIRKELSQKYKNN